MRVVEVHLRGEEVQAREPLFPYGPPHLFDRGLRLRPDQPLLDVGEAQQAVREAPDTLGYEIVANAQVRRPVQHGHVDPGVVHLGHQILGRIGHVRHRRREVLLGVLLSIGGPLEPPLARDPEGDVLQRVEAGPVRLVDEGRLVSGRAVSQAPDRLEVGRDGMLQMAPKGLRRRKASVTAQGREWCKRVRRVSSLTPERPAPCPGSAD